MSSASPEKNEERYPGQHARTQALAEKLHSMGLPTERIAFDLLVMGRTLVTVTCRPLPSMQDRLWFWVGDDAVCDAEDPVDAAAEIAALASRGRRRTFRLSGPGSGLNV